MIITIIKKDKEKERKRTDLGQVVINNDTSQQVMPSKAYGATNLYFMLWGQTSYLGYSGIESEFYVGCSLFVSLRGRACNPSAII